MNDSSKPWYETAFQGDYLERYAHRDDHQAQADIAFIVSLFSEEKAPIGRALDLCCGAGRHSRALLSAVEELCSLDLSKDLLKAAKEHPQYQAKNPLVQGDMRSLPFRDDVFELVVHLFTSFGYFPEEADNQSVLTEVSRVLSEGGHYFFDYLNAEQVMRSLVPENEEQLDGLVLKHRRELVDDNRRVEKTTEVFSPGSDQIITTRFESVRLYTRDEIEVLFETNGLRIKEVFGDLRGAEFTSRSQRLVILASNQQSL